MASYPFLYGLAASILPQLEPFQFRRSFNVSDAMEKHVNHDTMKWKKILSNLPSILETLEFSKEGFLAISNFVFDFHIKKQEMDWMSLVEHMTKFNHHYNSKTRKPIILQSSLSSSLHKSKQPIEDSSSGVNLEYEFDTRTSPLLSSLTRALSSLKAPDVKPLDDLPPQLLPCLAYCALYPQGSTFVPETLIYQWVAEGFLQVEKGNLYFKMLLDKGVFVEPIFAFNGGDAYKRIHSCKMHPDIHRAVCGMASNEVLINPGTNKGSAAAAVTTRYVALHKDDDNNNAEIQSYEFPFQPTTFMCFIPEINNVTLQSLLSKFTELRVLHFAAGTQFEELPRELIDLRYLRYLALSRNTLLKSLDCSHFRRLQILAVDGCVNLENVDAAWTVLEILQLSHCPKLKSFTFTVSYRTLHILHIFECPRLESLPKAEIVYLEELVCHNCDSLDLDLGECWGYLNYVEVVGLPKLKELKLGDSSRNGSLLIANCSNLKSIDNHLQKSINSLETLRIYDCPNLEISSKVLSSMITLRSIDIKNCPTIMTTTFSNEAIEDLVPWIWNNDREFIFDGHRHSSQDVLFEETVAALEPLLPSSSAQTSSYVPMYSSYFKLTSESSKMTEDSKGILEQDLRRKMILTAINEIKKEHKLYCCLLSSGFEFERDTLVQLWMASLGNLHERLKQEQTGERCFNDLMAEGFIIYSRTDILAEIDKYKINDEKVTTFLNDFKRKESYARLEDDQVAAVNTSSLSKCRHVSLVCQNINEETFKTLEGISKLRTVLLIRDYGDSLKQIPSSFFEALTCMRALDLSGSHISELPSSIGNMTQLHFLDLSFTLLERIPESITRLGELQTLKLKGCKHLHTLPKGMKQLRSLRHLDFDVLGQLNCMPEGMGLLTELRTLQAFIVSEEDGCSLRELGNLYKLGGSLCISGLEYASEDDVKEAAMRRKSVTGLHLKWNDTVSYDNNARGKVDATVMYLCPSSLKELKISYYPGLTLPQWDGNGFNLRKLARLELISCKIERFTAPEMLPNLKYLNITDMNGVRYIGSSRDIKTFPSLETLIIDGMLKLETWTGFGNYCPRLSKLRVTHCPKLFNFFQLCEFTSLTYLEITHCDFLKTLSYSRFMPNSVETLIINNCPLLKERCSKGGVDYLKIKHVPNIWIDMKGIGSADQDSDSDSEDDSYSGSEY